jgi:hypothetical protein
MCGSPSGMVRVGRSTCAGGEAHRRRGVRPIQGTIDQLNGSESFTRDQGRCVREELKNDSPDCSVSTRRRAAKSGEDDLGFPVKFCRVRELGKLHKLLAKLSEQLAGLESDRSGLATAGEARVAMAGGRGLAGAKEGRVAGEGEHGVR